MTKLIIDGKEVDVPADYTLLQACESAGVEIPRFCYHERLSIAGNCRMCLVEVKGSPKPVASCAWGVRDCRPGPNGEPPVISTRSPMVKKAREGVMEFILINHPLDCPICDQGGECDLQDQAMGYGIGSGRFTENKRAVEDRYLGVLIRTAMSRCIKCTRCVRFSAEIAGVPEMGAIGRGEDVEITTYLQHALSSELQGNLVDVCPVGALTSKPYAYTARPWELSKTQSIDVMDGVGSAIRVDARGREVMRILPRLNEAVNEEWISDKTRHIVDGLRTQRLDRPFIRDNGRLRPASWSEAFAAIAAKAGATSGALIGAIAGDLAAIEEMFALKALLAGLNATAMAVQGGDAFDPGLGRGSYIFNPTLAGIEEADALLLVGTNPRREAAVFNARIRKRWREGGFPIGLIGARADLTYGYEHLGPGAETLAGLAGAGLPFLDVLKNSARPVVMVGSAATSRRDGAMLTALSARLALEAGAVKDGWNGFGVLHDSAARVGALDIGFATMSVAQMVVPGALDLLFLLGADEVNIPEGAFVVYIGSHGDRGAHRADVILPGAAYTEKSALYVNTEGRVQMTGRATFAPGDAREDWAILRALSEVLGCKLPFDSLGALRQAVFAARPHLARVDDIAPGSLEQVKALAARSGGATDRAPFAAPIEDFYLTNPIARASAVMAECSRLASGQMLTAAE
ncbi:MAG: NADH-quinone oxidoreductase subunit NuoG [Alphaproteobacteria bacterium]|nr:NADH-quinone oxidoreductase subunit NuoG [Alphaproteobacteria bacterium]